MAQGRAEDFLELVERSKRGRLKIYLGFAPGVGKTYRMLEEAHALKSRGVDVVLGFVETHQRLETEALVAGLEQVPLLEITYRGVGLAEMDLAAVVRRRPQVALVDEVAHTNAPGLKTARRYQDVFELLAAGINVICAFNIQHLESLHDLVQRATGVVVRETVPDRLIREADQLVMLDLAVEDLQERLAAGKIYRRDKIDQALENFFRSENLSTLRELALREVAEALDRPKQEVRGLPAPRQRPSSQRVMVCLAPGHPAGTPLLRRGSRMAGRYSSDWFAVTVLTPAFSGHRIDAGAQRQLLADLQLAKELGAEVFRLEARDPVTALIDFARSHGVAHLVLARSTTPRWRRWFRRSAMSRIVRQASEFDLHLLSIDSRVGQA